MKYSINQHKKKNIFTSEIEEETLKRKIHKKKLSKRKKRKISKKKNKISNMKTIEEEKNKNKKENEIKYNDDELEEMDYEEAIIYDKRIYLKMYWCSLVDSQLILTTFFTNNNLHLFIIKLSFFIFNFEMNFFLNALFYTDDYISNSYHNNGVLDFVSGLPKSIYSFVATLILTNLLRMLSNSKSEFMKIIRENSKDKDYLIIVNKKIKTLKIKLTIYFILVLLLELFFFYYVAAFCAVYRFSQKYWFYGCLESTAMDLLIAFITCIFLSLLRFIAIRRKIKYFFIMLNIIGIFL